MLTCSDTASADCCRASLAFSYCWASTESCRRRPESILPTLSSGGASAPSKLPTPFTHCAKFTLTSIECHRPMLLRLAKTAPSTSWSNILVDLISDEFEERSLSSLEIAYSIHALRQVHPYVFPNDDAVSEYDHRPMLLRLAKTAPSTSWSNILVDLISDEFEESQRSSGGASAPSKLPTPFTHCAKFTLTSSPMTMQSQSEAGKNSS
jgi:hypothetical protein